MLHANIREATHIEIVRSFYDPSKATIYYYKVDKDGNWAVYSFGSDGTYSYWVPLESKPRRCFSITELPQDFLSNWNKPGSN